MTRMILLLVTVAPVTLWYVARVMWGVRPGAPDPARAADHVPRKWASMLLRLAGVKVVIEHPEHLDPDAPQILVSNHQSWFDVLALAAFLPGRYCFVAKKEVRKTPFLGWAIERCGHIFIDRRDHQKALESLGEARQRLEEERPTVIMFAEGTRSESGELQRFKKGAFVLAIQTGADVVPAAITGSRAVMRKHSFLIRPGTIVVRLGPPLPVGALTTADRDTLMRDTWDAVAGLLGSGDPSTKSNQPN